jgi:hypothetical protein
MATLRELIQDVNTILDYNPDLESYKKQVARALNRHYEEISGQYPWLFLQKLSELQLYAAVQGSTSVTVNVNATNRRQVTGTGTAFHSGMEGQTITINGFDRSIIRVTNATTLYVSANYTLSEVAGSTSDWSIQFLSYAMPADCGEVLGIMDRVNQRGRFTFVDARKEEEHLLDASVGGDATVSIEQPSIFLQAPEITAAGTFLGGSLTVGDTYEYLYTIVSGGMESPPSRVVSAVPTVTNQSITLTGLSNLDFSTGNWSGRRWNIYRRQLRTSSLASSPYFLIATVSGPGMADLYLDTGSVSVGYETPIFNEQGFQQRLRMWFTPESDQLVEVRYQSVPRRLQSDDDQPTWPKQYHHLLVYRALQDAAAQHGATQLSVLYQERADKMLDHMRQRWLSRSDRQYVRRGFDRNLAMNRQFNRWGIPSKS